MIDDVLADDIDRRGELSLDEVEVAIDGLLQDSAFWLYAAVHGVLLHQRNYLLFG